MDDVDVKISEQNVTAFLLLVEKENFNNSLLECYNEASELWDSYKHRLLYNKYLRTSLHCTIT